VHDIAHVVDAALVVRDRLGGVARALGVDVTLRPAETDLL